MTTRPSGDVIVDDITAALAPPKEILWTAGLRWAINAKAWIGFLAPLPGGRALLRYEYVFRGMSPALAASAILDFCRARKMRLTEVVAQPDIFPGKNELGEFPAETLRRGGIPVRPGHKDRIAGWTRLRAWLDVLPGSEPPTSALIVHPECKAFLRTAMSLVAYEKSPDDVQETIEEYPAMGAALWAMARPAPWTERPAELPVNAMGHLLRQLREAAVE
jgi:hypothetical protein